ncbi:NAD-P-binding protein [Crepidotus variabilis]|uniref:NAD-P-binding protein n=1 Tax=Crepidotus variabilis TaxID=179855 RepID=A0A9P6EHB0_9AGAR|nr:NAD-P-binding protein [Crepidotus variabilis]
MAMALGEAGARAVYCLDLPKEPSEDWTATQNYLAGIPHDPAVNGKNKHARLEYISADVTDQERMWAIGQEIGDKEKRMDICVAAAGIPSEHIPCLEYPADAMRRIVDVNMNGALFTAQAAGRQMQRFGKPGSIVLIASMSGSITNKDQEWVAYNSSKAGVIQIGRSMACELGKVGIRVNTVSPGYIYTKMSAAELDTHPDRLNEWSQLTPMNRIGRPDELRGAITWLASDASSYCTGSDILVSGGHTAW